MATTIDVELLLEQANISQKVKFISAIFVGMDNNNKLRTFMSMGRDTLGAEWLSARGIMAEHDMNYRKFLIEQFLSGQQHEKNIDKLFSEQAIYDFCESLVDEMMYLKETSADIFDAIIADAVAELPDGGNGIIDELVEYTPVETDKADAEQGEDKPDAETDTDAETDIPTEMPTAEKPKLPPVPKKEKQVTQKRVAQIDKSEYSDKEEKMNASMTFELPLAQMIGTSIKDYVENKSGLLQYVDKRILEEAAKLRPTVVQVNDKEIGKVEGRTHKSFANAIKLIMLEKQLFVSGAAGTGKTTLAEQIAKSLSLPFAHISCTAGMSEAHLLGRMVANGDYVLSSFVDVYENGGVFLFDEVDAADANTMLVINSALANGTLSVPNRRDAQVAKRHKDFYCVCAANTWGWGSNEYAGRNILDAAFLDRFAGSKILVDYDTEMEAEISGNNDLICKAIWNIRANCIKYKIRRVVSTRAFVSARRQTENGFTLAQFIDTFTTGWSNEEKNKALEVNK